MGAKLIAVYRGLTKQCEDYAALTFLGLGSVYTFGEWARKPWEQFVGDTLTIDWRVSSGRWRVLAHIDGACINPAACKREAQRRRCRATTKAGDPCRAYPLHGLEFCAKHATPAQKAERAILAEAEAVIREATENLRAEGLPTW